ncbi:MULTISPECIES: STAS-like domain-containing protein [unclassified Eikenella]|uniref:STAS-like domain-containing protein n=1 Tax=unclassified Eikenella TaxID=2639367 RepID=UPI0007DE8CE9|nr:MULTISPECIES: STAS-like domain-containing protein [unclassified Eikenella]OAM26488.1 hypothetical protein A7P94_07720 [Eikenella sp. NML01-A-086]OAM43786.1 hypothetical protein A7Q02_00075 [Eikenella sp. NML97-A-109]
MERIIHLPSGSLAYRRAAIPIRDQIIKAFENPAVSRIIIDLQGVDVISGSFADESIAILVKIYGWDKVKNKLRLRNGNGITERNIAEAILIRRQAEDAEQHQEMMQHAFA